MVTPILEERFPERENCNMSNEPCRNGGKVRYSIEIFLAALFYLCFVPCRLLSQIKSDNTFILKRNTFQQVICALVHFSALWNQVRSTILEKLHADILSSPINLIPLLLSLFEMLYLSSWMHCFWFQPSLLQEVALKLIAAENHRIGKTAPQHIDREAGKFKPKPFYFLKRNAQNATFTLLLFVLYFWTLYIRGSFMPTPNKRSNHFLEFYKKSASNHTFLNLQALFTNTDNILIMLEMVAGKIKIFLFHSVEILAFILIRESYLTAAWYKEQVILSQSIEKGSSEQLKSLFQSYVHLSHGLESYFVTINKFGAPFFLSWYCMVLPWMSYSSLETFSSELYPWTFLYNWGYLIILTVMLVLCAETRRQVYKFKAIITKCVFLHDPQLTLGRAVVKQVKHSVAAAGIHIGPFAVFSYGFLGSTIGLVIAYTFLILQLHISTFGVSNSHSTSSS